MAKLVKSVNGNFDPILQNIVDGICNSSMSASLEAAEDFRGENAHCSVRVFERYSYFGNNRVSITVTLFQEGTGKIYVSGITAGGSQAIFSRSTPLARKLFWISSFKFTFTTY